MKKMGKETVQVLGRNILHWPSLIYGVAPASPTLRSVFVFFVVLLFLFSSISNGNRAEWSPIRSVIIRVITKSDDRAANSYCRARIDLCINGAFI